MTYGTILYKNGKIKSYLEFSSGKRLVLKDKDAREFKQKVHEFIQIGRLKEREISK